MHNQNSTETPVDVAKQVEGKRIKAATSSLKNFSIEFDDSTGLSIDAVGDKDGPAIKLTLMPADQLPSQKEAVCSVDWSWIYSAAIKRASAASNNLRFELDAVGPLSVGVSLWQGSPFLSFQPFRPPAR